jgi:hypothetical protein
MYKLKGKRKIIDGTQENWRTDFLEVQTIIELEKCVHYWPVTAGA